MSVILPYNFIRGHLKTMFWNMLPLTFRTYNTTYANNKICSSSWGCTLIDVRHSVNLLIYIASICHTFVFCNSNDDQCLRHLSVHLGFFKPLYFNPVSFLTFINVLFRDFFPALTVLFFSYIRVWRFFRSMFYYIRIIM